jgi:hypothetical protein
MQLHVGSLVRVWDDGSQDEAKPLRACWREGDVAVLSDDAVEVTVLNGDHPLHPWQPETITVPCDPAFFLVRSERGSA